MSDVRVAGECGARHEHWVKGGENAVLIVPLTGEIENDSPVFGVRHATLRRGGVPAWGRRRGRRKVHSESPAESRIVERAKGGEREPQTQFLSSVQGPRILGRLSNRFRAIFDRSGRPDPGLGGSELFPSLGTWAAHTTIYCGVRTITMKLGGAQRRLSLRSRCASNSNASTWCGIDKTFPQAFFLSGQRDLGKESSHFRRLMADTRRRRKTVTELGCGN